jgi:hypothetical protein
MNVNSLFAYIQLKYLSNYLYKSTRINLKTMTGTWVDPGFVPYAEHCNTLADMKVHAFEIAHAENLFKDCSYCWTGS